MLSHSKSSASLVPVLVDQFNDIIELKAQVLQKELQSFEAQKVATAKVIPGLAESSRRYSVDDMEMSNERHFDSLDMSSMGESAFPMLKRSKSQKCFSRKLNRARQKAIKNTINEGTEGDLIRDDLETIVDRIASIKAHYQLNIPKAIETPKTETPTTVSFEEEQAKQRKDSQSRSPSPQSRPPPQIEATPPSPRIDHQQVIEDLAHLKFNAFKLSPESELILRLSRSPSPVSCGEIEPEDKEKKEEEIREIPAEPQKPMPTYNVLIEKLRNVYRHNFIVKTQVVDIGSRVAAALGKSAPTEGQCMCGEPFTFSDKTLQCLFCLTKCHTHCGPSLPTPCIKYVDPNLRPSKLISNYVYPRSRPSCPALLVNCCREIEAKCSLQVQSKPGATGLTLSSLKLYYVESERLKMVKDECKRILCQGKLGWTRLDNFTLDQLCGMVKYFLMEICEPVFTPAHWKQYSVNINKKTEDELLANLLDTFDAMPPSHAQTLCFMLLHLKHLHNCGYQDMAILVDIFCPILLGDLEVRRKWRLMKIMLQLEDNVLLSFVEK